MCDIAKQNNMDCYAGQFQKYEGLTVNASEAINGAGGSIVGEDGKTATVDSPEAITGLDELVNGFKNGDIPKPAITYTEEEGRHRVRGRQAALPAQLALRLRPGRHRGLLQGQGQVRRRPAARRRSRHRRLDAWVVTTWPSAPTPTTSSPAIDFINFVLEEEQQRFLLTQGSLAPALESLYTDETLVKDFPYLPDAEDLDRERGAAPHHAVLPGRHQGDPGQRVRRAQG